MLLDVNGVIIVDPKNPVYQFRTTWFRGQFRSTTIKGSRPCDLPCFWVRRTSELGNFKLWWCRILDPVWFAMLLDENDVIIIIPTDLVYNNDNNSTPRVISHAFGWEGRHHCHSERPRVSICSNIPFIRTIWFIGQIQSSSMNGSTKDLTHRAIFKYNYRRFSTTCYFSCFWIRSTSSFSIRNTSCINSFERMIIWFTGQFRSTAMYKSRPRVIPDAFWCHRCQSERLGVSIVWTIWFTGQFQSRTMKDSWRRIICLAFRWEWCHHCYFRKIWCTNPFERFDSSIWFIGRWSTTMKEYSPHVIFYAFGREGRHR
jgi:hypothetical protein